MFRTPIYRELNRGLRDVVGEKTAKEFARLGVVTVDDLVRHVPRRYVSGSQMTSFDSLEVGQEVAVVAKVHKTEVRHGARTRVETTLTDGTGGLRVTFFAPPSRGKGPDKAQALANYWAGLLAPGARGLFIGKVGQFNDMLQLTHPDFVILDGARITAARDNVKAQAKAAMQRVTQRATMIGLYPATGKLPTWVIADTISMVVPTIHGDTLPDWVVAEAQVPPFDQALREVHEPVSLAHAEDGIDRLRFDEAFGIQLAMAHRRATLASEVATPRPRRADGILDALDERLPFTLTAGQQEVGETIFDELARPEPMHRLLQGEVGSGKTLVALRAMLAVVDAGGQAVLVAPTEVLAKQHHQSITRMLGDLGHGRMLGTHPDATSVTLLTGSLSTAERRDALNQIVTGEAGIVIGTHALFSDPVEFFDLGLVVIDEQHRFGVEQRAALNAKAANKPHMLVMTATPIPRSIAMTIFGDLAVSELRERPAGRAEVQTVFVNTYTNPAWVDRAWERIREEVAAGRQAFIVCPAISADEKAIDGERRPTAVTELANRLAAGPLKGLRLGIVHGKQPADERDRAMAEFAAGQLDVLVATTVIEVGVDVPNASVMVVMDADRFGISQLHQLRGRIGRGGHSGLCLLMAPLRGDDPTSAQASRRLGAVAASTDGFALAETDLEIRREGDVLGAGQSGASSLKILQLADVDLIERAKQLAERVIADERSSEDPLLQDLIAKAERVAAGEWLEKG
jgi:ATP-dependent DNA helicase RecG